MSLQSEIVRILNNYFLNSKKISDLPTADTPTGSELIEIVQGGVNKKITSASLATGGTGLALSDWDFVSEGGFPNDASILYIATTDNGSPGDSDYVASGTWFIANVSNPSGYSDFYYK